MSTEQLFFGAGQVSPLSQSIQPIQPCADYCHLHFCIFFLFVDFAESHECKDREQICICKGVLTTHREDTYALCLRLNVVSSSVENFPYLAVSNPNMYDKGSIVIYVKNILINELCKFCYKIWSNLKKKDTPT